MVKITRKAIAGGTGLLLMAGFAFPGAGVCDAATITYDVNQTIALGTVTGTIQTDGATGVLGGSDFTGWNLMLNGPGASYHLTNSNSVVLSSGSDVTATPANLYFNFSGTDGGLLLFQNGLFSGNFYYCDATSSDACLQGASVTPTTYDGGLGLGFQNALESGNQVIATATPLPSAWTMLIAGLGAFGFLARRGWRRRARAPASA